MDGKIVIKTALDNSDFDRQIDLLEDKLEGLVNDYNDIANMKPYEGQKKDLRELSTQIVTTKKSISQLRKEQNKLKQLGFEGIKNSVENIGKGLDNVTKKAIRWGLAVFGIRSAFMFVRNAMNTIAENDEQLKTDIDYMKNALAYTLEPLVRAIVNLAKQLMFYIGYIIKAWTGRNIFENANKSLKNANTQATKLSKTLAGFDEMNILGNSSSGGGGGITTPSFDLSNPDQINPPRWLTWIAEHKNEILATLGGIATALALIGLGIGKIKALGIGTAIAGIIYAVEKLLDYLKDPTWENFGGFLQGLSLTILGIAIAFGLWPIAAGAAGALVIATIIKYWDKIKVKLEEAIEWLESKSDEVRENFGIVGQKIYDTFVKILKKTLKLVDETFTNMKGIFDGLIKFINGTYKNDWSLAWEGLCEIASSIFGNFLNTLKLQLMTFFTNFSGLIISKGADIGFDLGYSIGESLKGAFKFYLNAILDMVEYILNIPIRKVNSFIGVINKIPGVSIGKIPEINLPRLAKGGIINQPGRGVMVGSAIGGERGAEGVIPLTDSQQMALLGESIGKYITVDITNITNLDGRQIARKVEQINQNNRFVLNR